MASNADGSIVIDTELDNEGFESGSNKLMKAIEQMLNRIEDIGNTVKQSVTSSIPALQTIANTTQQIYSLMASEGEQAVQANRQMTATQQEMGNAAQQTTQAVQQQVQAVNNFSANAGTAGTSVSSLEREVNSLSNSMRSISDSAQAGFNNGNAVLSFDAKLTTVQEKLEAAKQKLIDFGNTRIPTEDFTWLQQNIAKAEAQLNSYIEKQIQMENSGVSHRNSRWQNIQAQIEQATVMLETYRSELEDLEATGGAFTLGSDTQQFAQMQQSLQTTEAALQRNRGLIDSEAIAQARLNVLAAQEQVAVAQTTEQRQAALTRLQQAQEELRATAAVSANNAPSGEAVSGWQRFGNILKSVASGAVKVSSTIARMGFNAVANGAKKAVSGLKSFASQSKRTELSTKSLVKALRSLKNMLISRLKYSFISSIMNSTKEGIQALAKFSSSFNQSMSNIVNSSKQLGGNLAVSMGNIIQAVEPVVTKIINLISTAITYLNAFFAMLSGKSTMTVAKKSTDSYADSVSGAAAAQKELNRQVYGFDELNKRNKESSSSSGSSGSGSGIEYEEVPIDSILPDSVKDFFQQLKDAITAGDWYEVGQIIADGLNSGMKVVDDWINNTFRPMGVKWAGIIATILNGLVDGFDWDLLGKTIADGLNAAFDIANTFLTTFNFENLGKGVGTAINSFFANTDWNLLGQTIANGIMAAVNFAYGIITTVDFLAIGSHIAELLNSAIETANFTRIGETLGGALRGAIQTAFGFVENVNWDELSKKINAAAQAFLDKMNAIDPRTGLNGWQELGTALADCANGIVQAFESIPWGQVAKGVGETISTFLSKSNIEVKLLLGALAINGISKILFGKGVLSLVASKLGSSILESLGKVWPSLGSKLTEALSSLGTAITSFATTDVLAASAGQIGAAILSGLFIGGEIGKLLDNYVIGPLIEALGGDEVMAELYKNFHWFGEGGFFDEMWTDNASFLENVQIWGDALGMMFSDIWSGIKSTASKAWGGISSALGTVWGGIKSAASTAWSGISSAVSGAWSGVKSAVSGVADTVKSGLSTAWTSIKTTASTAWNGIKTTVTTAFTTAKTSLTTTAGNIKTGISTAWTNLKTATGTAWNGIKTSVTTAFTTAKTSLTTTAGNIKTSLSTTWASVKGTATQTWNNIKSSVSSTFSNLKSSLTGTAGSIKSAISSTWASVKSTASSKWSDISSTVSSKWSSLKNILKSSDWTSIGSNLVSGLKSGISNAWSNLTTSVGQLCSNLLSKVKSAFGIHSPSKAMAEIGGYLDAGMQEGIEDNEGKVLSTAKNLAAAVTDGMSADVPGLENSQLEMVNGLDLVAGRLEGIAATFKAITDMIAGMGGLVVPQIAEGTIVPYKTKIDTTDTGTDPAESEFLKTSFSDVDERLADVCNLLKRLETAVGKLDLNIDISALERAITKQTRSHDLNFGGV